MTFELILDLCLKILLLTFINLTINSLADVGDKTVLKCRRFSVFEID